MDPDHELIVTFDGGHTLGNLIRAQLLKDERVVFAGYTVPDPRKPSATLVLTTAADCPEPPTKILQSSIREVVATLEGLEAAFQAACAKGPSKGRGTSSA